VLEVRVSYFYDGDEDRAAVFGFLRTHGAINLLRAFSKIEDEQVRRAALAVVRSAARIEQKQRT
jgi:hypothetical protein